jgi:hypothetical protein
MAAHSRARSLCEALSKIVSQPSFGRRVSTKKVGGGKKKKVTGGGKKKKIGGKKRKGPAKKKVTSI